MRDTKRPDYYQILKLSPTATDLEIKSQYRRLSKQYHPDMGGSHADMANVNEAYRVLSDSFRRSIYDAERRRALRVPPREPEQAVYAAPRKQATPRKYTYSDPKTAPKRKRSWWAALSWSFAVAVILIGILMQLPLAEANDSSDTDTPTTSKPLSVTYPADNPISSPTTTNSQAAVDASPDSTRAGANAQQPVSQTANPTQQSPTIPCSDDSCPQSQSDKNCITKTIGIYKHTICSTTGGGSNCTTNTVGTHRYTMCY